MQPKLYLFVGYPGAGKTTVSKLIADATGAEHVWVDQERQQRFGAPTHSPNESQTLYADLNQRTGELLAQGKSVLFDTNFNLFADREKLREIARQNGAETVLLWITTPVELAKQRATGHLEPLRNGYPVNMSDETFDGIASRLEPPQPDEQPIRINGTNIHPAELLLQLNLK